MQHYWSGQMPPHYYCWWYSTNFGYYNNVWSPRVQAFGTCFEFVWKRAGFLFDSMRLRQNQSQLLTHLLENGFGKNLHLVDMWAWKFSGFDVGNLSKFYCKQFIGFFSWKSGHISNVLSQQIDANNIQDILIMDRRGNISIVQDWAYVHNRAFTIAVQIIDNDHYVLLKE